MAHVISNIRWWRNKGKASSGCLAGVCAAHGSRTWQDGGTLHHITREPQSSIQAVSKDISVTEADCQPKHTSKAPFKSARAELSYHCQSSANKFYQYLHHHHPVFKHVMSPIIIIYHAHHMQIDISISGTVKS